MSLNQCEEPAKHIAVRELAATEEGLWEDLLARHPAGRCVVPMWEEQAGWALKRIGAFCGADLVGGLILGVRSIPWFHRSLGRVTCAMVDSNASEHVLKDLLQESWRHGVSGPMVELEVRLRLPQDVSLPTYESYSAISETLAAGGYRQLGTVDHSYLVRIDRDDEELLMSFGHKCRNLVRKAWREGIEIRRSEDPELLEEFYGSYLSMCERKKVAAMPRTHVVDGMKPLIRKGHAELYLETYSGRVANMVVVDTLGMPCYMLGTRTEAAVRDNLPSRSQAVQFEIMRRMRDRGKVLYDLGGCEGPEPIEGHPNYGVWHFKHSFSGQFVDFLPYCRKYRSHLAGPLLEVAHWLRGDSV